MFELSGRSAYSPDRPATAVARSAATAPADHRRPHTGVITPADPSAVLDAILDGAPGPSLAAGLLGVDPAELSSLDRFEYLRAWSRVESWVAARKARAVALVADLDQAEAYPEGYVVGDAGVELVAGALRVTPRAAQSEVGWSRLLINSCTRTHQALEAGAITARSARVITEETLELDAEQVAVVESLVLERAETQTPHELRRSVRRAVARAAPQQETVRCEQEAARRSVNVTPAPYGMAFLDAYLPAPEAQALYSVLTECAHVAKDRDRQAARDAGLPAADAGLAPLDAYRADALVRLGARGARELVDSGADPARWQAHIVVDLLTALGLADNPAELRGYGPIPGPLARRLAQDAQWTRWLTDPVGGSLVDVGRRRYVPSDALREFIAARDQRCRFPGCETSAQRCDLDHAQSWEGGGETNAANLGALCRRHHRMKTHGGWSITESNQDGSCTWRAPTGHKITTGPEPIIPKPISVCVAIPGLTTRTTSAPTTTDPPF